MMENPNPPTRIEDESAIIELIDGIIHFNYKEGIIVDLPLQKRNISNRIKIANGQARPIFADARNVNYWTKQARDYSLTDEGLHLTKAFGIVHSSAISKILINWLLKFVHPKVPIRYFTSSEEALHWLEQFK